IHHRLIALGFSHRNAVLALYGIALGLSAMALLSVLAQYRNAGIILVAAGLATYIGIRKLGYEEISFLRNGTLLRWYEQLAFNRLFFLGFVDLILITAATRMMPALRYCASTERSAIAERPRAMPYKASTALRCEKPSAINR